MIRLIDNLNTIVIQNTCTNWEKGRFFLVFTDLLSPSTVQLHKQDTFRWIMRRFLCSSSLLSCGFPTHWCSCLFCTFLTFCWGCTFTGSYTFFLWFLLFFRLWYKYAILPGLLNTFFILYQFCGILAFGSFLVLLYIVQKWTIFLFHSGTTCSWSL